jgi:sucrose-6F-phosphate phosphohydrolase
MIDCNKKSPGSSAERSRWLFVSDVDDTLLGDDAALAQLAQALEEAAPQLTLAYNSSRPIASLRRSLAANSNLPLPDYLIGALGTEIEESITGRPLSSYQAHLAGDWSRERVAELAGRLGLVAHAAEYQTPLKASYDVPNEGVYKGFQSLLEAAGIKAKVIFSGGKNLDIIPSRAGKGEAIHYLRQACDIRPDRVVVAGDSGNDLDMFVAPYRGIVVANADSDLKERQGETIYHARAAQAGGVLEGLIHWQLLAG